jgi:hydrogenase 3 maturation protease
VLIGETAPENLTGEIKKSKPSHLIIIDAAEISKKSGEVALFGPQEIKGISFCTHQLPMNVMVDYLRNYIDCEFLFVGIQPKSLKVGNNLSKGSKDCGKIYSQRSHRSIYKDVKSKKGDRNV